jgi:hypothetical protein
MTQSIDREQRQRASMPHLPESVTVTRAGLITAIKVFTCTTVLLGVIFAVCTLAYGGWRHPLAAMFFALTAVAGGTVLCFHAILADRQEFYRRGQLDGWYKGWRGQAPDVDDPLFK